MQVINEARRPIKAWVDGVELEDEAKQQLLNVAQMPFIHRHIAVMPDVHWGMGATIGSVIPTLGAVIPAAVGVDIGCGMMAAKTNLKAHDLPDNLRDVRDSIEIAVPHGRTQHGGRGDKGSFQQLPKGHLDIWGREFLPEYKLMIAKHPKSESMNDIGHLGTLGSGNHFIEVCLDEDMWVWIMLHSGSRGVGNRIGSYFIELAKKDMKKWMINLPDVNLAYLPEGTEHFMDYWKAVSWAQKFAMFNRTTMMSNILDALSKIFPGLTTQETMVNCHHNYVSREHHFGKNVIITRKGAVSAKKGEAGIIPGSMGAKSFIVKGKGNPESFHSCSHGAGRRMSRRKARDKFSVEDHEKATQGVECRKDRDVIDETPGAYKSIDAVMKAQEELVDVVHTLKQVVCVKG